MIEKEKNLYQEIHTELVESEQIDFAGGVVDYCASQNHLAERVNFFIAPHPQVNFDPKELESFFYQLETMFESGSFHTLPGWMKRYTVDWKDINALTFGCLKYEEAIYPAAESFLNPRTYLQQRKNLPGIPRLIYVRIYPTGDYAAQIHSYQQGLMVGEERNSLMDWLTHSITEEQIDYINKAGGFAELHELPPLPKLHPGQGKEAGLFFSH